MKKRGTPDATPIDRFSFEYTLGDPRKDHVVKAKVVQFPLKQAAAINVHKTQGINVKAPTALVGDMESCFQPAMAYVMLSRIQNINQLYLKSFAPKWLKAWPPALKEAKKIREESLASPHNLQKDIWNVENPNIDFVIETLFFVYQRDLSPNVRKSALLSLDILHKKSQKI